MDMILDNIRLLIKKEGVDIFCLQETSPEFEAAVVKFLRREGMLHWKAEFVHKGVGGHVGLLWNTYKLSHVQSHTILLPNLGRTSYLQKVRGSKAILQRVALLGQFRAGGKTINVVSSHFSWEGGFLHRFKQVKRVRAACDAHPADCDVVAGDFNTIGPKVAARLQKRPIERIFGEGFMNAHPHLKWTFDTSFGDPLDDWDIAGKFRRAGVKWRSRLDYVFARNLRVLKADMYDLPGSDHRPLIATFTPVVARIKAVVL